MTAWTNLVKKEFAAGKKKDKSFSLGDAMKSAKKLYKKKKGGDSDVVQEKPPSDAIEGGEGEGEEKIEQEQMGGDDAESATKKMGGDCSKRSLGGKRRKTAKK